MSQIISPLENADGTIIVLGAFIVARRLRGCRRWAVQPLNQKISSMSAYYTLVPEFGFDNKIFQKYSKRPTRRDSRGTSYSRLGGPKDPISSRTQLLVVLLIP